MIKKSDSALVTFHMSKSNRLTSGLTNAMIIALALGFYRGARLLARRILTGICQPQELVGCINTISKRSIWIVHYGKQELLGRYDTGAVVQVIAHGGSGSWAGADSICGLAR